MTIKDHLGVNIKLTFDIGPALRDVLTQFLATTTESTAMTKDEALALLKAATDEITTLAKTEHDEVMQALAAVPASGTIPDDLAQGLQDFVAATKQGVSNIYNATNTPNPDPNAPPPST